MAKARHNDIFESIFEIFNHAKEQGVMLLTTEDANFSGKTLLIENKHVTNFGTCGYLALETDERLINGAIDTVRKYGTQFSVSRAYLMSGINEELESLLEKIFNKPVLVSSSTSLIHMGIIPLLIKDQDMVILDHQVHASVQNPMQMLKARGVPVEIIRHNNLQMLEDKIKSNRDKYRKIWYAIDGVYSMNGDFAPIKEIEQLMNKYPELNLYVDDAHGMSWSGNNGQGYILSQIPFHDKMILVSTLGKGFGVTGGLVAFPSKELADKIKLFGGAISFSHPIAPPLLGAAIASAKIHLSSDISELQTDLAHKIALTDTLLKELNLPVLSSDSSPIFFVGLGTPSSGYKVVKKLLNEGYYSNLAVFPAVPVKNTGLRFTISRHLDYDDIKSFVGCVDKCIHEVFQEELTNTSKIFTSFKLHKENRDQFIKSENSGQESSLSLNMTEYDSILQVPKDEWNNLLGERGSFDWDGLKFQEDVFSGNLKEEYNWKFKYLIIRNSQNIIVLATFYTTALWKEDMLAPYLVSKQIEKQRQNNPYYLVSKAVTLGSFFTEGNHLYLNKNCPEWKDVLNLLISKLELEQEYQKADTVIIRDLDEDIDINFHLLEKGFIKVELPDTCQYNNLVWNNIEEYVNSLTLKSRKHFKKDILPYKDFFRIEIKSEFTSVLMFEFQVL